MEKINGITHLLLVDDNHHDQFFFQTALQQVDPFVNCTVADNGLEALKLLEQMTYVPKLIFLDLRMPVMDGKTFLYKIKQTQRFSSLPIIIYFSYGDENQITELEKAGADYFLPKPNSIDTLSDSLKLLLARKWNSKKQLAF